MANGTEKLIFETKSLLTRMLGKSKNILIIEPEEQLRMNLKGFFHSLGFANVLTACSINEARRLFIPDNAFGS